MSIIGDGIMLGAGGETASIVVTAPTGSTVTCTTPAGIVLTAAEVSGTWTFANLKSYGTYTITANNGSKAQSKNVLVDSADLFSVEIDYKLWLYRNGDVCEDVTGDWNVTYFGSSDYSTVSKNSDNIYMKNTANNDYQPYMSTNLKIDTSGYSKLCLVADAYRYNSSSGSPGHVTIEFKSTNTRNSYYFGNVISFTQNVTYTDKEFSWNLSSENNYLLIGITMAHMSGWSELKIKKIWLE